MIRVVRRSVVTGSTLAGAIFALLFTLMGNAVMAANEGVCDVLKGGTTGLYGLCVAYCEAQDLDSSDPPSPKILESYNRKMQAGDPPMPCLQAPCPCWSAAELGSITADGVGTCLNPTPTTIEIIDNAPLTHLAQATTASTREQCLYVDGNTSPQTIRGFRITPEEAQSCYSAISTACSGLP